MKYISLLIVIIFLQGCGLSLKMGRIYHADYYKEFCSPCISYHWREKSYIVGLAFYQVADLPWTYIDKKKAGMCIGGPEFQSCFGFFFDKHKCIQSDGKP